MTQSTTAPDPIQVLRQSLGPQATRIITPITGDGSDRSYYRIQANQKSQSDVVMMLGEDDTDLLVNNRYDWVHLARELNEAGVNVPAVKNIRPQEGLILIGDFGSLTLENILEKEPDRARFWYEKAIATWSTMASIKPKRDSVWSKRAFDKTKLLYELQFLKTHLLIPLNLLTQSEEDVFEQEAEDLAETVAAFSNVFCHRDYHARNIMIFNNELGIIDFQDARVGPIAYDLVSLCFDSYVNLSPGFRHDMLTAGLEQSGIGQEEWPPTLLQRQLKALGSFGYLTLDRKRGDYMKYVSYACSIILDYKDYFSRWPFLGQTLLERIKGHG